MLNCFGDSNTVGVGASPSSKSWVGLFTPINAAVSGSQAADVSNAVQAVPSDLSKTYTLMVGTNDVRNYKNNAAKMKFYEAFLRQAVAWLCFPIKVLAKDMTLNGSWSNTVVNSFGKNTVTSGDSATCQVSGDRIFVAYIIQNNLAAVASADVYIDGILAGTIVSDGYTTPMNTVNGSTYASACEVFDVSPGVHTVHLIVTSPNGKKFYLDYIAGNDQSKAKVLVGNVIKYSSAGYAYYGVTEQMIQDYNAIVSSVAAELGATLIDGYSAITPSADLADYVHLNNQGHQKIYQKFIDAF